MNELTNNVQIIKQAGKPALAEKQASANRP